MVVISVIVNITVAIANLVQNIEDLMIVVIQTLKEAIIVIKVVVINVINMIIFYIGEKEQKSVDAVIAVLYSMMANQAVAKLAMETIMVFAT